MSFLEVILLSFVQAFTEFLPVSSSAHLIIVQTVLGISGDNLVFDVGLHLGTVLAVVIFFRKEVGELIKGFFNVILRQKTPEGALFIKIFVASIPVGIVGLILLTSGLLNSLRGMGFIIFNLAFFGIVLYLCDRSKKHDIGFNDINYLHALKIGLVQCLALIPGVSRSGITISMARFLGIDRASSAKFSMLMLIPGVCMASFGLVIDIVQTGAEINIMEFLGGVLLSFIFALFFIAVFMNYIKKYSFKVFVIYRLLLSLLLLIFFI